MRRAFIVIALLFVTAAAPAGATSAWRFIADPVFARVEISAIARNGITAIASDNDHFLWIGTQGGLVRFDGAVARTYLPDARDPRALPDGYVLALLRDRDRGLWIGTASSGLVRFDAVTETFHTWRGDPGNASGARNTRVDALVARGDDLFVGGNGGLERFSVRDDRFTPLDVVAGPQPGVNALALDRRGTLWAATDQGLFARAAGAQHFRPIPLRPNGTAAAVSLYEDRAGHVWVGATNVVDLLDADGRVLASWVNDPRRTDTLARGAQNAFTEVAPGVMWSGTDSAISVIDASSGRVHRIVADDANPHGLPWGRVHALFSDRPGHLWISAGNGGLLSFTTANPELYELSTSLPKIQITGGAQTIVAGHRELWLAGSDDRLTRIATGGDVTRVRLPNHSSINALTFAADGTLWIGTPGGLCSVAAGTARVTCPRIPGPLDGAGVTALAWDRDALLVGADLGLARFDPTTRAVHVLLHANDPHGLASGTIYALLRDHRRRLWIGTDAGLDRLDPDTTFHRFRFDPNAVDSIGPGGINALMEDRDGRLWVGTIGGPLDVLADDATGEHAQFIGTSDGLPNENVDGMLQDAHGRVWVSTDHGLALIDPVTLRARALGVADGVTDTDFWSSSVSRDADGTMFFGSYEGVSVVEPEARPNQMPAPTIIVSSVSVDHRNVPVWSVNRPGAELALASGADVSIEFASPNVVAANWLRYRYRLRGYDPRWIELEGDQRTATFAHLPPGRYTFDVEVTNALGAWSSRPFSLDVRVVPAWYETLWFRVLVGLLVVLGVVGVYRVRTAMLFRRQRELQRIVASRTRELSEANAKLEVLSVRDPLTGLGNRRFLEQFITTDIPLVVRRYHAALRAGEGDVPREADLVFFLVDLDNLKTVNDAYGHPAGDALLMEAAARLRHEFRDADVLVRWGGDEFLAVARNVDRGSGPAIAERVCRAIADTPFVFAGGAQVTSSVSIGFAAFPFIARLPEALRWELIIALADLALYAAKRNGRNQWVGVGAGPRADAGTLTRALERGDDVLTDPMLEVVQRVSLEAVPEHL